MTSADSEVETDTDDRDRNVDDEHTGETVDDGHDDSEHVDDSGHGENDSEHAELVAELLDGRHRALARVITKIENRAPGYREIVSRLHEHTGSASVVGITGSPGAGKSTLVDKLAKAYRDRGETVGVIAVDPSSPYTGGAVLGDRIRMASNVGDMDSNLRRGEGVGRVRQRPGDRRDGRRRPKRGGRCEDRRDGVCARPTRVGRRRTDVEGRHLGDR
jgi:ABC-type glutathione transport system ATPase component